jgi:hypothetical protein
MGFRALATGMQLLMGLEKKGGGAWKEDGAPLSSHAGTACRHSREAQIKRVFGPDFFLRKISGRCCTVLKYPYIYAFINAGIAQLVEHNLAKVGVASSSLVSRSITEKASVPTGAFSVSRSAGPD